MMTSQAPKRNLLRISEAARAAGVSNHTLEYYIMLGLIEPIRFDDERARYFDDRIVRRIRLIRRLNRSGYTLRDIRQTYFDQRPSRRGPRRGRPHPRMRPRS